MRLKSSVLSIVAFVIAAAVGAVVLTAYAGGQDGSCPPPPPPVRGPGYVASPTLPAGVTPTATRTVEETSALSDRLHAEDKAARATIEADLITRHASVKCLLHGESSGDRIDAPLTVDQAVDQASALVIGRVTDQFLAYGIQREFRFPITYVVSVIRLDAGGIAHVAQPGGISRAPDELHLLGTGILQPGKRYAVLTFAQSLTKAPDIIRGHIYELNLDGSVIAGDRLTGRVDSAADLQARFDAAH